MENILDFNNIKNIEIENKVDLEINKNKNEFANIVENVIDKGTDYVIKALPVADGVKDILIDVKKAFKTKDFKEIVKVAVNSSIREGLEFLAIPKNVIRDITKIKDIAFSGGLSHALSAGIDIISSKYLKGNIFQPIIKSFLDNTKEFVFSNAFKQKIDMGFKSLQKRVESYKKLCEKWYESYEKFNIDGINKIAKLLNSKKRTIINNKECIDENNIIQNMTELINSKKNKLSPIQLQICSNL